MSEHEGRERWPPRGGPPRQIRAVPLEVWEQHYHELHAGLGRMTAAIEAMAPAVIGLETRTFDSTGVVELDFRVPFAAVAVQAKSFSDLTITAAPKQAAAPPQGPGVAILPAGNAGETYNLRGRSLSVYGGAAGEKVTVQAFARPLPPAYGGTTFPSISPVFGSLQTSAFAASSVTAHGVVAAPGAGAAIATTAALPNALYRLDCRVYFSAGAPAAADVDNFQLLVGAAVLAVIPSPAAANNQRFPDFWVQARASAQAASVQAIGAATAGVSYSASIVATAIGP